LDALDASTLAKPVKTNGPISTAKQGALKAATNELIEIFNRKLRIKFLIFI
jgi:hypothetical protein